MSINLNNEIRLNIPKCKLRIIENIYEEAMAESYYNNINK